MTINDVTYLSVFPNNKSKKRYSDIEAIVSLCNSKFSQLNFASKKIYTCTIPSNKPKNIEFYKIDEVDFSQFNKFAILNYNRLFDSKFMINFHCDGFIMNANSWQDDFLKYDYIGSPFDAGGLRKPCAGNGGFSLRSKKFCNEFKKLFLELPKEYQNLPEDFLSCHILRGLLIEKGIKFAPFELCSQFSTEHLSSKDEYFYTSFGMHEFKPISRQEIIDRSLNVDMKFISQNPEKVKKHRERIQFEIFNEK